MCFDREMAHAVMTETPHAGHDAAVDASIVSTTFSHKLEQMRRHEQEQETRTREGMNTNKRRNEEEQVGPRNQGPSKVERVIVR